MKLQDKKDDLYDNFKLGDKILVNNKWRYIAETYDGSANWIWLSNSYNNAIQGLGHSFNLCDLFED